MFTAEYKTEKFQIFCKGAGEEQKKAILHKDGPMMVMAGPGSGKTFTLIRRIRCLIEGYGIPPESILVITFTKAAALEMQQRFRSLCGEQYYPVTFGTFHAIYFQILRDSYHYDISNVITEKEKRKYLRQAMSASVERNADDALFEYLLNAFSRIKNDGITPLEYDSGDSLLEQDEFVRIFEEYGRILKEEKKLDFDDMVLQCRDLFLSRKDILMRWQKKFHYIMIDEFQDINPMQYEVIRMLAKPEDNLFIVGDDDQSIYGFRGSRPEIMLDFPKDYPKTVRVILAKNYRSTDRIVRTASKLVEHNKSRFFKRMTAGKAGNQDVNICGFDEKEQETEAILSLIRQASKYMPYRDMALIFRTNAAARSISHSLMDHKIPFHFREKVGSIFSTPIGMDIMAIFYFAHGDHKREYLLRFMNKPVRYIRRDMLTSPVIDLERLCGLVKDKIYMVDKIKRLSCDLDKVASMHPYAALTYIRRGMGYETYLLEEAGKRGRDVTEIKDTLDLIAETTKKVKTYTEWLEKVHTYEEEMRHSEKDRDKDAVQIVTMHGAKGLEYRMVIIPDLNEGYMPQRRADTVEALEEERRVFYVAMTRAEEKLFLFYRNHNKTTKTVPSRFLQELA